MEGRKLPEDSSAMEGRKLPEDILVEVLCRLPTMKSLNRFKCVCKRWNYLISEVLSKTTHVGLVCQCFLPAQSEHRSRMDFFHVQNEGSAYLEHFNLGDVEQRCFLVNSCNGFLLFLNRPRRHGGECVVYHPATKRLWDISSPENRKTDCFGLAASDGHHFKLVRITQDGGNLGSQVYSSHNGEWYEKSPPSFAIPWRDPFKYKRSVFIKGASHWIWMNDLLIYHLEDGDCEFFYLPRFPGHVSVQTECIWDSEGCLHYCSVSCSDRIGIWSLHRENWSSDQKTYNFRWKVKHEAVLASTFAKTERHIPFKPVAFHHNFAIVYLKRGNKLFSYNLATKEMKETCVSPFEGSDFCTWSIVLPFLFLGQFNLAAMGLGIENREIHAR